MSAKEDCVLGSGNVFADLNAPRPDEALAKPGLAHKITTLIERRGMTQAEAAAILVRGPAQDLCAPPWTTVGLLA